MERDEAGPLPEVVGHPRRTGRLWFDVIAASTAVIISLVSLFVAIGTDETQREMLAASTWPYLQVERLATGSDQVRLSLANAGVGPAHVISGELLLDGRTMRRTSELLTACCGLAQGTDAFFRALPVGVTDGAFAGTVLRPGQSQIVLEIPAGDAGSPVARSFVRAVRAGRVDLAVCYCSVLDRCWSQRLTGGKDARQVAACHPSSGDWDADDPER